MNAWFQGLRRSESPNVPLLSPPKLTVTSMDVNTFSLSVFGWYWPPAVLDRAGRDVTHRAERTAVDR